MRVFTQQLAELPAGNVPSHHKELSRILRQLAVHSAGVEEEAGSTVPEAALDVLKKLEVGELTAQGMFCLLSYT